MPNRTILLCATEAGGAKNIAPLRQPIKGKGLDFFVVASKATLPLFDTNKVKIDTPQIVTMEDGLRYLKSKRIMAMICGTTRYMSPERFFISAAKKCSIKTIVVLDEWFNYSLRFRNELGNMNYLPDMICCQDEKAKKEAGKEGVPDRLLHITGSPSLSNFVSRAKQCIVKEPNVPDFIRHNDKRPIITFLSETHSFDYGKKCGDIGPLGPYLGYTEIEAREKIIKILKRLDYEVAFIEKMHPASGEQNIRKEKYGKIELITVTHTDFLGLLWHSHLVIGMRSIALLESAILGVDTISFQPGLIGPQQCTAARLGLIDCISSSSELEKWLKRKLALRLWTKRKRRIKNYSFAREDAANNVVRLAM